jgi:hypothetical protein
MFIPVFYHVPKCAGTFILNEQIKLMHQFLLKREKFPKIYQRQITIIDQDINYGHVLAQDPFNVFGAKRSLVEVTLKEFQTKSFKLEPFAMHLTSHGIINKHRIFSNFDAIYVKWTAIKHPFDISKSLYYYITSPQSIHEPTHGRFSNLNSFTEHILSEEFHSNSLNSCFNIRSVITENEYLNTKKQLIDCRVYDTKHIVNGLDYVFNLCHNITTADITEKVQNIFVESNNNITKNMGNETYQELDVTTKQIFDEKSKWDLKIYNEFIQ